MSTLGLQVRCLASTRVPEPTWQRQETEANAEGCLPLRGVDSKPSKQEEAVNSTDKEGDADLDDHDHCESDDRSARISTSTVGPESDLDEDFESDSDYGSTFSSNTVPNKVYMSCIQEAQMSTDGTCIFTSDLNHSFSVYPIDTNIQGSDKPQSLQPYSQFTSADPIWAFASNPLFNINDSNSTHVLISRRDRYITLHNALWDISNPTPSTIDPASNPINIATPLQSYKLINSLTEAVTAPLSVTYSCFGTHFFAGHRNSIATFDLTYPDAPIHNIPTIPSARNKLKGGGRGFKGWISALALSPPSGAASDGLLAAGARTRNIGIFDAASGEEVTTFSLPGTVDGKKVKSAALQDVVGDGVSYLKYSPCGTYLYVAERSSDALLIYDVRNFSLALGYCVGRKASTKQKLGFDVWSAGASPYDIEAISHEVWAGGTDGKIRVWRDPYRREGAVQPDEEVVVGDGDAPVVGTLVHENGGLAVAACGRIDVDDEDATTSKIGNRRGGKRRPRIREYGSLDILGLA